MTEHRCPENICHMFDDATEEQKGAARLAAIEWMMAQNIQIGDVVLMPNPETGELIAMEKHHVPS